MRNEDFFFFLLMLLSIFIGIGDPSGGWLRAQILVYHRWQVAFPCYIAALHESRLCIRGFGLYFDAMSVSVQKEWWGSQRAVVDAYIQQWRRLGRLPGRNRSRCTLSCRLKKTNRKGPVSTVYMLLKYRLTIISCRPSSTIRSRLRFNSNSLSGANSFTELASDTPLFTSCVSSQCMFTSESG